MPRRLNRFVWRYRADTFADELVGPKAVFFPDLGAGDGNRTHDIQLGKLTYVIDFADPRSSSRRQRIETVGKTRSYPIPEFAAWRLRPIVFGSRSSTTVP
jgi:hypothetical protein